jgi:2-polyprenyl-3-methyl-5-hydroxy-6-metoxy-1,4-benzoquinol methylase
MRWIKKMVPTSWRQPLRKLSKIFYPPKKITTWRLDNINITPDAIEIHGWALVNNMDARKYSFTINGEPFKNVNYPTYREDIAEIAWEVSGAGHSGYYCKSSIDARKTFAAGYATFNYVKKQNLDRVAPGQQYYCPNLKNEFRYPLPQAERRQRVHGTPAKQPFILEGFTNYMKLKQTIQGVIGMDFQDFSNILDWGCGCGRLTRYFRNLPPGTVTGIDIDEDNISWCRENLPFGRFETIPLQPPTRFPDGSFDLLIGISIFTHLKEKDQFIWLKELHRLSADNAVLLMSIHGEEARRWINFSFRDHLSLRARGFRDIGSNVSLKDVMDCNGYYRNVYHTQKYIHRKWSQYFDILDIIPAYIGNIQDLVIMKKKITV